MMETAEFQQTVIDALAGLKTDLAHLDEYVRNHLTTGLDNVANDVSIVKNMFQDHIKYGSHTDP